MGDLVEWELQEHALDVVVNFAAEGSTTATPSLAASYACIRSSRQCAFAASHVSTCEACHAIAWKSRSVSEDAPRTPYNASKVRPTALPRDVW